MTAHGALSPPAAPVTIRPATALDLDAIAAIERVAFADPWSRTSFVPLIGGPHIFFVVATRGVVVGYLVAWIVAGQAEIANVAVAPSERGQGIGATLLHAVMAEAEEEGASEIYLDVRASNDVARRLYARRGFEEVGRRRSYYRAPIEDALTLRRRLPEPTRGQDR